MLCQRDVYPRTRITAQFQDRRDSMVSVCPTTVTAVSMAPGCTLLMWWLVSLWLVMRLAALATCRQKLGRGSRRLVRKGLLLGQTWAGQEPQESKGWKDSEGHQLFQGHVILSQGSPFQGALPMRVYKNSCYHGKLETHWKTQGSSHSSCGSLYVCHASPDFLVLPGWSAALPHISRASAMAWSDTIRSPSGLFASSGLGPPWTAGFYAPSILHAIASWPFVCILGHSSIT